MCIFVCCFGCFDCFAALAAFSDLVASVDFCYCLAYCAARVAVRSTALLRNLHTLVLRLFFQVTQTHIGQRSLNALHTCMPWLFCGVGGIRHWSTALLTCGAHKPLSESEELTSHLRV